MLVSLVTAAVRISSALDFWMPLLFSQTQTGKNIRAHEPYKKYSK